MNDPGVPGARVSEGRMAFFLRLGFRGRGLGLGCSGAPTMERVQARWGQCRIVAELRRSGFGVPHR